MINKFLDCQYSLTSLLFIINLDVAMNYDKLLLICFFTAANAKNSKSQVNDKIIGGTIAVNGKSS